LAEVVSYRDEVALHVVRELVSKFGNDSRGGRDSDLTPRGCHNNDFVAVDAPGLEDFPGKSFRDVLPFGRLWYGRAEDAIGNAKFYSRSHPMIVRMFDESGALIETHDSEGAFREP
jgi:hypothetical protein